MGATLLLYHVVVCKTNRILIGPQFRHIVRYNPKKSRITFTLHGLLLYHFTQRKQAFYALMPYYPMLISAFCHLLLNLFNSVGQKKKQTNKQKQSHAIRVTYCECQSVSSKIIYIILSKIVFFDFCSNLSVICSKKLEQGQTSRVCAISQNPPVKNSGLGQG